MFNLMWFSLCTLDGWNEILHRSTFLIMLRRIARVISYEFGEALEIVITDLKKGTKLPITMIRIRFPLGNGNLEHYFNYSVSASKGIVPNQISIEVFFAYQFFAEYPLDWRERLAKYEDFCDLSF